MQPRIIVLTGPSHATKVDLLGGLIIHLQEHYGKGTHLQPDALGSSVVLETTHVRVGIIRAGHDPRKPEVDHVGDMIRRRCALILWPMNAKDTPQSELAALAQGRGYCMAYWQPMRVGEVPRGLAPRYTQAQERGWAAGHNVQALITLVEQLIND